MEKNMMIDLENSKKVMAKELNEGLEERRK